MKRSVLTEGRGIPIGVAVDGANRHDSKLVEATLESMVTHSPLRPQHICLDKGYDYPRVSPVGLHRPHPQSWGREACAYGHTRIPSSAHSLVPEPVSASVDTVGEECGELSGHAAFRLRMDYRAAGVVG